MKLSAVEFVHTIIERAIRSNASDIHIDPFPQASSVRFRVDGLLKHICAVPASGGFDLAACVVPAYISSLPFDPSAAGAHYISATDYDTEYTIYQNSDGQVTASSTGEITPSISVTR